MPDILHVLSLLPERCAAELDGQSCFIRRGAREPDLFTVNVSRWNAEHHVEPWQVEAMKRGLHLGWEHALVEEDTGEARFWKIAIPIVLTGVITAYSQDEVDKLVMDTVQFISVGGFTVSQDGSWDLLDGPSTSEP